MDKSGDGRLTKADLVLIAESKRDKVAAHAKARSTPSYAARLESHARDLLLPAFLGAFAFMDISTYGVVLMVSGINNACVIGIVLGSPPSIEKYKRVTIYALSAGVAQAVAIGWMALLIADTPAYMRDLDPVMKQKFGATLNANNYITLNETIQQQVLAHFNWEPQVLIVTVLYISCFVFGIGLDLMTAHCSYNCLKELRARDKYAKYEGRAPTSAPVVAWS